MVFGGHPLRSSGALRISTRCRGLAIPRGLAEGPGGTVVGTRQKRLKTKQNQLSLAERVGFEPTVRVLGGRVQLLCSGSFDGPPLKEAFNGDDAATLGVGPAKGR